MLSYRLFEWPCPAAINRLLPTDLEMKRTKESGWDNQDSNKHNNSLHILIGNRPGSKQITHFQYKQGGHKHVIPFVGTEWERREKWCIARALADVPRGTSVLNWPCEHGRLLPFLKQLGYSVTCADSSSHEVAQARFYGGFLGEGCIDHTDDFQVVDILQAGFTDSYFDAALVNHLFCHFPESQLRQRVLKELGRICSGPIVVPFFHIEAAENIVCYKHDPSCKYQRQKSIPKSRKEFAKEVGECDLNIAKWVPRYSLNSKQACAVIVRNKSL